MAPFLNLNLNLNLSLTVTLTMAQWGDPIAACLLFCSQPNPAKCHLYYTHDVTHPLGSIIYMM